MKKKKKPHYRRRRNRPEAPADQHPPRAPDGYMAIVRRKMEEAGIVPIDDNDGVVRVPQSQASRLARIQMEAFAEYHKIS